MHRHHGQGRGRRRQDGHFNFQDMQAHLHAHWQDHMDQHVHGHGHGHDHLHNKFHGFMHQHFHRGHGTYDHDGRAHGMFHAGWHFLERLADRMPWHAMGGPRGSGGSRGDGHGRRGWGWGGGGGGGFGGMGGDGEGDEFTRGRKLSSMDLQLLLLAMLAEKPGHGYELIKAIEALSNGFYAPSPGMVYPALTYLEELGHLIVAQEGNRKSYSLSDSGREQLAQNKERVEAMMSRLAHIGAKMESMRRAYSGEGGDFDDGSGWSAELIEAKHKLKSALFARGDMTREEQKRIADILLQAARSISGG